MEAKGCEGDGGSRGDSCKPSPPANAEHDATLVHRFVNFCFKTINHDMNSFFEANLGHFNQNFDEMRNEGETVEQFNCYMEYKEVLEQKVDQFSVEEGFNSNEELVFTINKLVKEDLVRHKKQMEEMMRQVRKAQKRVLKRLKREEEERAGVIPAEDDFEESESSDSDDSSQTKNGQSSNPSYLLFFNPTTLEQLVDMVLNLGEYQTFSMMMRMKMQQKRVIALLEEARNLEQEAHLLDQEIEARQDAKALGDGGRVLEHKDDDDDINADDDEFFFEGNTGM